MERITAKIRAKQTVKATVNVASAITGKLAFRETSADPYTGRYRFTPTNKTQVIESENKLLLQNMIIEPIPKNYGLITWNGSFLTVS